MNSDIACEISQATSIDELIRLVINRSPAKHLGRTSFVITAKGDEVKTAFRLVEATKLIPSNLDDGKVNPAFPAELQPRDRTRAASKLQIIKIANGLRPQQLTDSGLSSHGAPIIGPDNVVESGNGRTMGLIKAYKTGRAEAYKTFIIENARLFGLSPKRAKVMRQPVLVRVRLTDLDRAKFARDSNKSDLQQMSAAETAWSDADSIGTDMMALFAPSDAGNLMAPSNKPFITAFLQEIGDNSTAGLVTEDGRPTKQLIDRMQNAVFAKAYKNERLVKLVSEEPDPEIRNILTAMNGAAGRFVEMQYLSGEVHKQTTGLLADAVDVAKQSPDLADNAIDSLVQAAELVRKARESGQSLDELLSQSALFGGNAPEAEALARFISANNRSAKRLTAAFSAMADEINSELAHQGQAAGDMFGGGPASLVEILVRVEQRLADDGMQTGGFQF